MGSKCGFLATHQTRSGKISGARNDGVDVFDSEMVEAIEDKKRLHAIAARKYPDAYLGGLCGLTVAWIPQGYRFEIAEYDGSESVRVFGPDDGYVA